MKEGGCDGSNPVLSGGTTTSMGATSPTRSTLYVGGTSMGAIGEKQPVLHEQELQPCILPLPLEHPSDLGEGPQGGQDLQRGCEVVGWEEDGKRWCHCGL